MTKTYNTSAGEISYYDTLVFDLESIPDESRFGDFDLPPVPGKTKFVTDEEMPPYDDIIDWPVQKIAAFLAGIRPTDGWLDGLAAKEMEKEKPRKSINTVVKDVKSASGEAEEAIEARRLLLSTTPEYCKIVSMAWKCDDGPVESMTCGLPCMKKMDGGEVECSEALILMKFWDLAANAKRVVGWGIGNYDIPAIQFRSCLLDITPSRGFDTRPWGNDVVDLYAKRFPKGGSKGTGLGPMKSYAKMLGIKAPVMDVDGSKVYDLWSDKQYDKIGEYNRSDVAVCAEIANKTKGFLWE